MRYTNKPRCGFLYDDFTFCNNLCHFSRGWKIENVIDYDSHHRFFLCYKHRSNKKENTDKIVNNYELHAIIQINKQKEFFLSENKMNELIRIKLKFATISQ